MRQFLQSLCCTSQWDYAVVWKLQLHQDQALLTWDDGVFDISKPREPLEAVAVDYNCLEDRLFSTFSLIAQSGSWVDSPIAELVDEMSSSYYLVGKGVVGDVAHTETSRWIYAETIMCDVFNYDFKCPDELLRQFVAGIKTILLVPLVPYGVLQLGSLNKVAEDTELVTCIKNKFDADQQFAGYFSHFSSDRKFLSQSLAHMSGVTEYISELSDNAVEGTDKHISNIDNNMVESNGMLNEYEVMRKVESKNCLNSGGEFNVKELFSYPFHEHSESYTKQNFTRSSFVDEDVDVISYITDYDMIQHSQISVNEIMGGIPNSLWETPVVTASDYSSIYNSGNHLLRFPSDCELNKALGTIVSEQANLDVYCNVGQSSVHIDESQPLTWDCGESFEERFKVEDLLEAAMPVTNNSNESLKASSINIASSCDIAHFISKSEDLVPCITSVSSSTIKSLKVKNGNKKTRTGDKQKAARPRDRQLIQDRIKSLRELVPSSTKCSIDSLLEKTIKHMRFLRSVTDQADKVKHHKKDKETQKSRVAKGNARNGTSWAVEVGGEQSNFPIIVKDLEYPGHMLIEMVCSDHSRFLEIADAIHRLDLTILKGLMEKRIDDCTWAHFIVEASGTFHRLDIFWPLMQLLQQN